MNRKRDVRAMIVLLVVLVAGLFLGNWQRADAMVPEDILAMRSVALLDVAPDGAFLLYGVGAWDESGRENLVTIFRRDLATGRDQLLFTPAEGARGPVVRPDGGAIAYVRGGESGDELWLMDTQGGERRLVAVVPGGLGALHWSPAGDALAWIAPLPPAELPWFGRPTLLLGIGGALLLLFAASAWATARATSCGCSAWTTGASRSRGSRPAATA